MVSAGEAPAVKIGAGGYFSLAVDAGADPRFESYRVTVTDPKGARAFHQAGLQKDPKDCKDSKDSKESSVVLVALCCP
jgi:hypothetical protein